MAPSSSAEAVNKTDGRYRASVTGQSSTASEANTAPVPNPSRQSNISPAVDTSSNPAGTTATGFGLLAPADREALNATNGTYRDGRVRDPVPSKLKGKTDGRKGNFSVMHMDVAGRTEATERDAQAKRTSESTALAAKKAFQNGYVSLKRSRFVQVPDDSPLAPQSHRRQPLDPVQAKAEQARLLTLLRSLHPVIVVDQICKALAFFGGIPGAPPPVDDGSFPQSAEANGSGRLFVGWISEIFPSPENGGQRMPTPAGGAELPGTTKRKRGRPKGSKATKARKDKGIKKGPLKIKTSSRPETAAAVDDSWVDVGEDGVEEADMGDHDVSPYQQALNVDSTPQVAPPQQPATSVPTAATTATVQRTVPASGADTNTGTEATPNNGVKRRGRPKGSKNRPKEPAALEIPNAAPQMSQQTHIPQESQALQVTPLTATTLSYPNNNQTFTAVNSGSNAAPNSTSETPTKRKAGRPKGSKNKPRPSETPVNAAPESQPAVIGVHPVPGLLARGGAGLDGQPSQGPATVPSQADNLAATTQRRKRKSVKITEESRPAGGATLPNSSIDGRTEQSTSEDPVGSVASPPAKRQRKGKGHKSATTSELQNQASRAVTSVPEPVVLSPPEQQGLSQPVAHDSLSGSVDRAMPSLQSPQHSHFEVQSPTMENYEAQLQARLEQQAEPEPQVRQTSNRVEQRQAMANRLHLQQQRKPAPRQISQQQKQQAQHSQSSASQSISPVPHQQTAKQQASSSIATQQSARISQTAYSQYGQQPQSYSPQQRQQFPTQQSSPQMNAQSSSQNQQYPATTQQQQQQQQQQYTTGQHQYSAGNQTQYASGQQQVSSQQLYQQQLATSSAGSTSFSAHQSPQFGSPTNNNSFTSNDGTYRNSSAGLNNQTFASQRNQSATTAANGYRAGNTQNLSQNHSPSFGATPATQQRTTNAAHSGVQNLQQFSNTEWIFGTSNLDASGGHNALNLNSTYSMNAGSVPRASSNSAAAFAQSAITSFDPSGLGGNDRYYGVARR